MAMSAIVRLFSIVFEFWRTDTVDLRAHESIR